MTMSFSFGCEGNDKEGTGCGSEIMRTSKGFVTRLPVEAADALVVNAIFLVVSYMMAGEAE